MATVEVDRPLCPNARSLQPRGVQIRVSCKTQKVTRKKPVTSDRLARVTQEEKHLFCAGGSGAQRRRAVGGCS